MGTRRDGCRQVTAEAGPGKPVVLQVTEEHHVARARRRTMSLAEGVGLKRVAAYQIATCVTELANNLFLHATAGGTITLTTLRRNGEVGIEIICEDRGPGIPDVELALQDGFTTGGGLGGGIPGVKRLMDEFEITSQVGVGTRIAARKWQPWR